MSFQFDPSYFTTFIRWDTVLVAAHGNSIRALIKYLENVSDEDIIGYEIKTGAPLIYELDDDLKVTNHYYL